MPMFLVISNSSGWESNVRVFDSLEEALCEYRERLGYISGEVILAQTLEVDLVASDTSGNAVGLSLGKKK